MRNTLIDAGPLVALFSPSDIHHKRYKEVLAQCAPTGIRLVTTWPCIVEAAYLLAALRRFDLLRWIRLGGVMVYPFEPTHLEEMTNWMQQYAEHGKREMDLADAALYWLAVETGITEIMTTDRNDFERYRLPDGQRFNII